MTPPLALKSTTLVLMKDSIPPVVRRLFVVSSKGTPNSEMRSMSSRWSMALDRRRRVRSFSRVFLSSALLVMDSSKGVRTICV